MMGVATWYNSLTPSLSVLLCWCHRTGHTPFRFHFLNLPPIIFLHNTNGKLWFFFAGYKRRNMESRTTGNGLIQSCETRRCRNCSQMPQIRHCRCEYEIWAGKKQETFYQNLRIQILARIIFKICVKATFETRINISIENKILSTLYFFFWEETNIMGRK